jgi:hypothetical protein
MPLVFSFPYISYLKKNDVKISIFTNMQDVI